METSWSFSGPGAYVVSEKELGPSLDRAALEGLVSCVGLQPGVRILAWLTSCEPTFAGAAVAISARTMKVTAANQAVGFANVGLKIPPGTRVELSEEGLSLNGSQIQLQRGKQGYNLAPAGDTVAVSLAPPATGRLVYSAQWQAFELFELCRDKSGSNQEVRGGELRYFYGAEGGKVLSYPLFEAIGEGDDLELELDLELDPLAPFDGERTRMLFRTAPPLQSAYAATTTGETVTLTPLVEGGQRAGLYFGRRPGERAGEPAVYLAPLGPFELGSKTGKGELPLMCGTSGLEYLAAAAGDRLIFVPSQPAYAPSFQSKARSAGGEPLLDPAWTTSWVEFAPAGKGSGGRAYFGQPDASPNYATGVVPKLEGRSMTLPAAVASRVLELPDASNPFPLALYGAALAPGNLAAPAAATVMEFERSALAPERGARLRGTSPAPAALAGEAAETAPPAPVFNDATGKPLQGKTATPQGFVVELNEGGGEGSPRPGSWAEVQFARSASGQMLALPAGAGKVVDPWLSTSLVKDQLFLVLNDWSKLPALDWLLSVGGFDFRMAPKEEEWGEDDGKTILVFKFAGAQTLSELIRTTGAWELKQHFVGGEEKVKTARERLESALQVAEEAEEKPNSPFAHFHEIANDPTWTGMLAFNCLVPGTGMPPDLQMLYAGMEGALRAHHFGVELNRVTRDGGDVEIAESSLFGAIHYLGEPKASPEPPEFQFTLKELEVSIRNSAVTRFHATVLLQANKLFGREVTLAPQTEPDNTLTLAGQYQRHGEVGTVTFALAAPPGAAFGFAVPGATAPPVRVLDELTVSGASLVPVRTAGAETVSEGAAEAKEITAQVTLAGGLTFAQAPIPGAPELDLFTYGLDGSGIAISGFGLTVKCQISSDGKKGPTTIAPDLSAVMLRDPGRSAQRAEGLVRKLPLTLKGLLHEEKEGLDPTKLGALPVNVVELAGPQGGIASRPSYALQLSLPLGTLGGLADAHASLEASLILGWGPSTYTPDNDGIGVFVQLPFVSAGAFGLDLQGLLKTTFGDANLMRVKTHVGTKQERGTYVLLFNNIAVSVLGMKFPPRVIVDFILFAGPESEAGSNLGWSLAAAEPAKQGQARIEERV